MANINLNFSSTSSSDPFVRNARIYRSLCGELMPSRDWKLSGEFRFTLNSTGTGSQIISISSSNEPFWQKIECGNFPITDADELGIQILNPSGTALLQFDMKDGTNTVVSNQFSNTMIANRWYRFTIERKGRVFNLTVSELSSSSNVINYSYTIGSSVDISGLNYLKIGPAPGLGWNRAGTINVDNLTLSLTDSSNLMVLPRIVSCEKNPIQVFGINRDTSGFYTDSTTNGNGCYSHFVQELYFTQINDTLKIRIYDTTEIMVQVYDTIYSYLSVADTLRINLNNVQGCGNIDIKLYPNPARNFVYLEVSDFDCLVMSKFNLYNSIGQILWTNQLVEDRVIKIPVHTLAAGVYHVDCLDRLGNRMFVKKLVLYR